MYEWGDAGDRRAQLAHLLTMSRRPNVELRLLRLADGLHPGMSTLVNIFRFPGGEPPMVFLENDAAIQEIDTPATWRHMTPSSTRSARRRSAPPTPRTICRN